MERDTWPYKTQSRKVEHSVADPERFDTDPVPNLEFCLVSKHEKYSQNSKNLQNLLRTVCMYNFPGNSDQIKKKHTVDITFWNDEGWDL